VVYETPFWRDYIDTVRGNGNIPELAIGKWHRFANRLSDSLEMSPVGAKLEQD